MSQHFERARFLYNSNRFADAERELRLELSLNPDDVYSLTLLSSCLARLDRKRESMLAAKDAVVRGPESSMTHCCLARAFLLYQEYDQAHGEALEAVRLDPFDPVVFRLASYTSSRLYRMEESLEFASKAFELNPDDSDNAEAKASALLSLRRFDEADELLKRGLELSPEEPSLFIEKSNRESQSNNNERALEFGREALRLDPNSPSSQYAMGRALYCNSMFVEAEEYFRECMRMEPEVGLYHSMLALDLCEQKRMEDALESARSGAKLSPNHAFVHSTLARVLIDNRKSGEAEDLLIACRARWPEHADTLRIYVKLLMKNSRYGDALKTIEEFKTRGNSKIAPIELRIDVLVASSRFAEAIGEARAAVEHFPQDADVVERAARLFFNREMYVDACKYSEMLCALCPDNKEYASWYTASLIGAERFDEAELRLDAVLEGNPSHVDSLINKGIIQEKRKDKSSAQEYYERALAIEPNSTQIRRRLLWLLAPPEPPIIQKVLDLSSGVVGTGGRLVDRIPFGKLPALLELLIVLPLKFLIPGVLMLLLMPIAVASLCYRFVLQFSRPESRKYTQWKDLLMPLGAVAAVLACILVVVAWVSNRVIIGRFWTDYGASIFAGAIALLLWKGTSGVGKRSARASLWIVCLTAFSLILAWLSFTDANKHHAGATVSGTQAEAPSEGAIQPERTTQSESTATGGTTTESATTESATTESATTESATSTDTDSNSLTTGAVDHYELDQTHKPKANLDALRGLK